MYFFLVRIKMASLWQDFIDAPDYYEESPWFPNPFVCIRDIAISGTKETIHRLPWNGMEQWLNSTGYWLSRSWHHNDVSAVIVPLLIAVVMTLVRIVLNWSLFKVIVLPDSYPSRMMCFISPLLIAYTKVV